MIQYFRIQHSLHHVHDDSNYETREMFLQDNVRQFFYFNGAVEIVIRYYSVGTQSKILQSVDHFRKIFLTSAMILFSVVEHECRTMLTC